MCNGHPGCTPLARKRKSGRLRSNRVTIVVEHICDDGLIRVQQLRGRALCCAHPASFAGGRGREQRGRALRRGAARRRMRAIPGFGDEPRFRIFASASSHEHLAERSRFEMHCRSAGLRGSCERQPAGWRLWVPSLPVALPRTPRSLLAQTESGVKGAHRESTYNEPGESGNATFAQPSQVAAAEYAEALGVLQEPEARVRTYRCACRHHRLFGAPGKSLER